jgi:hypothetical protein
MMTSYWLTPIVQREPLILGKARILCDHPDLDAFREKLRVIHPRCLMMIKSDIIPNDEHDDAYCGSTESNVPYDNQQDLNFHEVWGVSHCAQAFLDHLPSLNENKVFFQASKLNEQSWTEQQGAWLNQIKTWHEQGFDVILIREG